MSESSKQQPNFQPEAQHARWIKYGSNVALVSILVIALAALLVYLAQRGAKRVDTTASGLYSLKPQTVNLIGDNKQKIRIVSLYTKEKPADRNATDSGPNPVDEAGTVSDLLEEYRTKGKNIEVENVDPVTNPGKVEDLINDVTQTYGGEVKKYADFAKSLPDKYTEIKKAADPEIQKIQALPLNEITNDDLATSVALALQSVRDIPKQLKQSESSYERALKKKPPDYKVISDSVSENMQVVSQIMAKVIEDFKKYKDDKAVPEAIRRYMADSLPKYEAIKKQADDLLAQSKSLGELKLDTLREALGQKNPILVRGETEWKVLPYDQVWKKGQRDLTPGNRSGELRPRFAGEQMITTAIVALNQPKKLKVCFVRAGGPPVTDVGFPPFRPGGMYSSVAQRLRDYNYDVLEKDLTGMWAMQSQGQVPPEPSDDEIKDAVWVVLAFQTMQQNPMMPAPPANIGVKLQEHLNQGGSALIVSAPKGEDLSPALKDWGVEIRNDAVCVHEMITGEGAQQDMIEEAKKNPYIFEIRNWGDHILANSLRSLPGILLEASPVKVNTGTKGVTATAIIPVPGEPNAPKCWGDTSSPDQQRDRSAGPTFNPASDIPPPLFAGAAVEKEKAGRIVVVGSNALFYGMYGSSQTIVDFPDPEWAKRGKFVARFPGNAELFMNSVYWLSHQESMIAISPAAMDVSRIADMSHGALNFWRVGVLLVGLPALVLVAGALVYASRRD